MFILGLLALLQILFLPGFAILYALRRPPLRSAPWLAGSFGLSLLANYLAVSCLVCCRVYGPVSLWLLMAVEGVAITLLAIRRRELIPFLSRRPVSLAVLRQQVNGLPLPTVILWASASVVLVYYVQLFFANMGTGFVYRDPVVSWNRWALDWSMNQPAHHTWHYPQVLPTNWSIVYVLTGGPIWYFPKALMPLFPLGILFLLIYQYRHTREAGWLLAVPLFGVIAKALDRTSTV